MFVVFFFKSDINLVIKINFQVTCKSEAVTHPHILTQTQSLDTVPQGEDFPGDKEELGTGT